MISFLLRFKWARPNEAKQTEVEHYTTSCELRRAEETLEVAKANVLWLKSKQARLAKRLGKVSSNVTPIKQEKRHATQAR
jgi:hypothetical protein